ncbi:MAG TPA: LytTR family DNA-binding domain-containing protein [Steroidobacteraceae bacterium]|nr:LytTR family DNA-binding domain-containing protein [Steroidobacteraceae bacterium]
MNTPISVASEPQQPRTRALLIFISAASACLFLSYLVALLVSNQAGLAANAVSALCNVVSLVLLALGVRGFLRRYVIGRSLLRQVISHAFCAVAFASFWYWALMVLFAFSNGKSLLHFDVRPVFQGGAIAWQVHQGLTFYCLVAALTYLEVCRSLRKPEVGHVMGATSPSTLESSLSRYFIKKGEDIKPVEVAQIISISGAGDYTEVSTLGGRHLARLTLAEFEEALGSDRFIRIHRSKIVNLDRITRAEPAGAGRVLLHMENGESLLASRSGSKLFRERVI